MGAFLFTCPTTDMNVHGWTAEEASALECYEAGECVACKRVHLVNPRTGKVVGGQDRK